MQKFPTSAKQSDGGMTPKMGFDRTTSGTMAPAVKTSSSNHGSTRMGKGMGRPNGSVKGQCK